MLNDPRQFEIRTRTQDCSEDKKNLHQWQIKYFLKSLLLLQPRKDSLKIS